MAFAMDGGIRRALARLFHRIGDRVAGENGGEAAYHHPRLSAANRLCRAYIFDHPLYERNEGYRQVGRPADPP